MPLAKSGSGLKNLILQPGAEFSRTKAGFDTGAREFKCDRAYADDLTPLIGTPDADMRWVDGTRSLVSGRYPWMFVENARIVDEEAQIATIRVNYAGQMTKRGQSLPSALKKPVYTVSRSLRTISIPGGGQLNLRFPVVTSVYLVTRLSNLAAINSAADQPDIIGADPDLDYTDGAVEITTTFAGWVLQDRKITEVGIEGKRRLWQIEESIGYEVTI